MDLSKKYRTPQDSDHPDLGNFVHYYIYINKLKKKSVSEGLGIAYNTFNQYLKQPSFQFTILWRISKILNYNFLMDLGQRLAIPFETEAEKKLKSELAAAQQQLEALRKENELLMRIVKG